MRGQDLTEFEAEFESTLLSLRALLNSLAEDAAKKRGVRRMRRNSFAEEYSRTKGQFYITELCKNREYQDGLIELLKTYVLFFKNNFQKVLLLTQKIP